MVEMARDAIGPFLNSLKSKTFLRMKIKRLVTISIVILITIAIPIIPVTESGERALIEPMDLKLLIIVIIEN